ncbi:MAG: STAS domain-containing protein [Candidatus Promineifilaceae bacterium]|nr:STAS domain-containing protein [Candidatus Promineifilaceae bacterium]
MTISCEKLAGDIWIISSSGRLDHSLNPQLEQSLNDLLNEKQNRLIVDLSHSNYINSGGLRCLVTAWRQAREQGGDLRICGLNNRMEEIFSLIGFDRVFSIHRTHEDARQAMVNESTI